MKKTTWFIMLIALGALVVAIWVRSQTSKKVSGIASREASPIANPADTRDVSAKEQLASRSDTNFTSSSAQSSQIAPKQGSLASEQQGIQAVVAEQNAAIDFHGVVVDQEDKPVVGAKVNIGVRHWQVESLARLNAEGTMIRREIATGSDGRFNVQDVTGDGVQIDSIHMDGYELSPKTTRHFGTSAGSSGQPVVFRMWKKGPQATLVTGDKFFGIIPDGRTYTINLLQGTKSENDNGDGDLQITVTRPNGVTRKDRYNWSFSVTPVQGGIVEANGDFMYEAPVSGYATNAIYRFDATGSDWKYRAKKDFFLVTRNKQNYARISVEVFAFYDNEGVFSINYAVNPTGSRNLQP